MLTRLIQNHVMANLTFLLILVMGSLAYLNLPRQQDPEINFNWIDISIIWPGAAAEDVEKLITKPVEDAIAGIADIRFVSSSSREGSAHILVRFNEMDDRTFDKRIADLRREIQNAQNSFPEGVFDPRIMEITTANAFPAAMVILTAPAYDENFRRQATTIIEDIKRIKGVNEITRLGFTEPELQVNFLPNRLDELGISPLELADTVALNLRDSSAGSTTERNHNWLVRLTGAAPSGDPLAAMPLASQRGEVTLGDLAVISRTHEDFTTQVSYEGRPALLLGITKKEKTHVLELLERIRGYIDQRNPFYSQTGVQLILADDQTLPTRHAIDIMQSNALFGLGLVVVVAWIFLGSQIAFLVSISIPFILAATFWLLAAMGQTLNQSVLLGVVIALGMLVDDGVVIAEAIYYRLQRGMMVLQATVESIREVMLPVVASVLTTVAAFLPLMLLPGILGQFMMVIPLVVSVALAVSLVEASWMLPAHIIALKLDPTRPSRLHRPRAAMNRAIRIGYTRLLVKALRWPKLTLTGTLLLGLAALGAVASGQIKMDFFASDPIRLFYITVEMDSASPLAATLKKTEAVEAVVRSHLAPAESRSVVSYAGLMFTETSPFIGEQYGQVMVSLNPATPSSRSLDEVIESMRTEVLAVQGAKSIAFIRLSGGPPVEKPIKIKVRGDDYTELRRASQELATLMQRVTGVKDISDDAAPGSMELRLELNYDAIRRAGLTAEQVRRAVKLLVDGERVATLQDAGEKVTVRVRAQPHDYTAMTDLLNHTLPLPTGAAIPLRELLHFSTERSLGTIRHYNFRRAITVEADIDKTITDAVAANRAVVAAWQSHAAARYPNITLDTTGILDDINEALSNIMILFIMGLGLIYLILGTQFGSYFQPLTILVTIPLAFTGVVLGLLISGHPLSLYTLYGVVALAGIAVNSAIVLISAANDRLKVGMSLLHATLYAARRRVIPILITSLTTVAGLLSLATGLGGQSLIWGPVATAIVWGLAFSTLLTLLVIPLLYRLTMHRSPLVKDRSPEQPLTATRL